MHAPGTIFGQRIALHLDNLGIAYEMNGDPDSARRQFQAALQINPDDPTAIENLAKLGGK